MSLKSINKPIPTPIRRSDRLASINPVKIKDPTSLITDIEFFEVEIDYYNSKLYELEVKKQIYEETLITLQIHASKKQRVYKLNYEPDSKPIQLSRQDSKPTQLTMLPQLSIPDSKPYPKPDSNEQGIYLFRIKTKFKVTETGFKKITFPNRDQHRTISKLYDPNFKQYNYNSCKNDLQVFQARHILLMPNLLSPEIVDTIRPVIGEDCLKYLEKLLAKKLIMDFSTEKNTEIISSNPNENPSKNMIDLIRNITSTLNNALKTDLQDLDTAVVPENFDTLNSISKSNLPLISIKLLEKFLDILEIQTIIANIKTFFKNITELTSTFKLIKPFLYKDLHLKEFFTSMQNIPEYNDLTQNIIKKNKTNLHITINIFQPEYIKNIVQTEDDLMMLPDISEEGYSTGLTKGLAEGLAKGLPKKPKNKSTLRKKFKKLTNKLARLTKKCKKNKYKQTKKCKKFNQLNK